MSVLDGNWSVTDGIGSGNGHADGAGIRSGSELDLLHAPLLPLVELGALGCHGYLGPGQALPVGVLVAEELAQPLGDEQLHLGDDLPFDGVRGVVLDELEAFGRDLVGEPGLLLIEVFNGLRVDDLPGVHLVHSIVDIDADQGQDFFAPVYFLLSVFSQKKEPSGIVVYLWALYNKKSRHGLPEGNEKALRSTGRALSGKVPVWM